MPAAMSCESFTRSRIGARVRAAVSSPSSGSAVVMLDINEKTAAERYAAPPPLLSEKTDAERLSPPRRFPPPLCPALLCPALLCGGFLRRFFRRLLGDCLLRRLCGLCLSAALHRFRRLSRRFLRR